MIKQAITKKAETSVRKLTKAGTGSPGRLVLQLVHKLQKDIF
jgi:hypothetical protein